MAWLGETDFRAIYVTDSASEVKSEQIDECLNSAKGRIKRRVLPTVLADVSEADPQDAERADDVRRAQGKIAYAELLLIQSARYRSGGILQAERDSNETGQNTYETYSATEKRADRLKAEAFEILETYYTPVEAAATAEPLSYSGSVPIEVVW